MRDLAEIPPWDWPPTESVSILEVLGDREVKRMVALVEALPAGG